MSTLQLVDENKKLNGYKYALLLDIRLITSILDSI